MESIIQKEKQCLVCGTTHNLHSHHVFFGTSNRKQSEKYGLKVWLCQYHHTGTDGVHFNKHFDNYLKIMGQRHFEARYGDREEFRRVFGKSYL